MNQPRFSAAVTLENGRGGLPRLVIQNQEANAEIYQHGAHLTHWQPKNQQPVLWMSAQSIFAPTKPIRGGVPICFPWFGPKTDDTQAPAHGLARIGNWKISRAENTSVICAPDDETIAQNGWPQNCAVQFSVLCSEILKMSFNVHNAGQSTLEYEIAHHTYFAVGDVRQIEVRGLEDLKYFDKVAGVERKAENTPIRFTGETDRVYSDTTGDCIIVDPILKREITIHKADSLSTIVWNPWIAKAAAMPDFGDDEWPQMVCIETANVGANRVRLEPNQSHTMSAEIAVRSL